MEKSDGGFDAERGGFDCGLQRYAQSASAGSYRRIADRTGHNAPERDSRARLSRGFPKQRRVPAFSINGYSLTVAEAVYCETNDGDLVMMSGEYNGMYALLMFASTTGIKANTSFSRSDFGSTMELMAVIAEPLSGLSAADSTSSGITVASISVGDISDSGMNITMSVTMNAFDAAFDMSASGTVTLTDLDTCTRIVSEFDELVQSAQNTADSNRQPFTCTGCKGSLKCQHCDGDGSCSACLGLIDHCISCGGTDICQYCRGSGTCSYCNGTGVMY